jgi:hypothetical protein
VQQRLDMWRHGMSTTHLVAALQRPQQCQAQGTDPFAIGVATRYRYCKKRGKPQGDRRAGNVVGRREKGLDQEQAEQYADGTTRTMQ